MQREEKTVLILLAMAALSLSIAYLTFFSEAPGYQEYTNDASIGDYVEVTGTITYLRTTNTGEHLVVYLEREEGGGIMLFFPGGAELSTEFGQGDQISVCGRVSEYKGMREIVVEDIGCLVKK